MAGHNKWSKVKHIKGAADAKRGKLFSRLSREISVAARQGGGDVDSNARLRTAIMNAKAQNMPHDTIERAVKKGTGEIAGGALDEVVYEGYGPGGVAILVEAATDNKNRTAADVRTIFTKNGGNLGNSGSVAYLFSRKGQIVVNSEQASEEDLLEKVIEAGGEELTEGENGYCIETLSDQLYSVAEALKAAGVGIESQSLVYAPENPLLVSDARNAAQLVRLCEALEECDDVQNIYANFEIPDEVLEGLPG